MANFLCDLQLLGLNVTPQLGEERLEVLTVRFVASTELGRTLFHV